MKKLAIVATLALIIVGVAAGLSYHKLYFPMNATVSREPLVWQHELLPLNFWSSDVMPDGTTIIATDSRDTGQPKVWKSLDEGLTWTEVFTIPYGGGTGKGSLTFCDSYGNIYVSYPQPKTSIGGLWRSTDGGTTWDRVWQDGYSNIRFDGMCEDDDGILYFGVSFWDGGPNDVYRSTDQGATWEKIANLGGGKHIHALRYNPYNGWFYAVVGDVGYSNAGLWRSKDNCLTWEKFTNIGGMEIMTVDFYQDYVYAVIHWEEGQIMRLRDNDNIDATWTEVFRSNLRLQNFVRLYQRDGNSFMLSGAETGSETEPVCVWVSETPPFDSGTWTVLYTDGTDTGYAGTSCASHKISKNGWLFVSNNYEGQGLRIRYSAL